MIDYTDDIAIIPSQKLREKKNLIPQRIQPLSVVRRPGEKRKDEMMKADDNKIPLYKWTMPAQQQGYIKCSKYDFL
jgi:hypothetical protein